MRTLLIDDLRDIKADRVARTFDDGIKALLEGGPWDILYLDHDLGEMDGKDGTGIINWIEEHAEFRPGKIELVTANPVGRERMKRVIERIYGLPR